MIYAVMVARNEEHRYLQEVLQRLNGQVDKIIFTDDCSSDNTPEIASQYAQVYRTEEVLFTKHEGMLRAQAWHNLEKHAKPGDWVVAIDADEKLYTKTNESVEEVLSKSPYDVANIRRYEMWNSTSYRVDKMWAPHNTFRVFRFARDGVYKDKKLACGSEPTYVESWVRKRNYWFENPFVMQHMGYIRDEDKQSKYDRYMTLDKGEFHNLVHLESILDKEPVLIPWGVFGDLKLELL